MLNNILRNWRKDDKLSQKSQRIKIMVVVAKKKQMANVFNLRLKRKPDK